MSKLYCVYIQQEFDTYVITGFKKKIIAETKEHKSDRGCFKIIFAENEDDAKLKFKQYYDDNPQRVVSSHYYDEFGFDFVHKDFKNKLCIMEPKEAFHNYCFETLKEVMEPDNFMDYCKYKMYPINMIME